MNTFRVEVRRAALVESVHRVSVAVVGAGGGLVALAGDPDLLTYWRSAAKPFQALPLVEDGVLERFGLGPEDLALACASHSSEPRHRAIAERMLAAIGCDEADLACGPHPPLGPAVAREVAAGGVTLTSTWSNCSGKHAGMLALARFHGWPTAGYHRAGHPVQERILQAVRQWTGLSREELVFGVDGCTTVCFGLSLRAMARAYAALAAAPTSALAAVRTAMMSHPELVAGEGRFCTELMQALPGHVVAKVGAEGVHCAAVPGARLGVAIKVEDGDMRASPPALLGVLAALAPLVPDEARLPAGALSHWARPALRNTRGETVGEMNVAGELRFVSPGMPGNGDAG